MKGKGLEFLEEILQYSKKQEIKNLQGWLLSVVKSFEVPKQVAKKGGFTDYEQRDYDFEKIMEEIEG